MFFAICISKKFLFETILLNVFSSKQMPLYAIRTFLALFFVIVTYLSLCYVFSPRICKEFVDFSKCSACYGDSYCNFLFDQNNSVILNTNKINILNFLNARNVYFGSINQTPVVFKKLSHNWEMSTFDKALCALHQELHYASLDVYLTNECNIETALSDILEHYGGDIAEVVVKQKELFGSSDATQCFGDNKVALNNAFQPFQHIDSSNHWREHLLTSLAINPEFIIFSLYNKQAEVFPAIFGACGRVVVEEYKGVPLRSTIGRAWHHRANYAVQILQIALKLTDGHPRLYLADPSADNFAVDHDDKVWLVDAENIIILDPLSNDLDPGEHVHDEEETIALCGRNCFSFSVEDLCHFQTADHNFYAVCKVLLASSPTDFESLPSGLLVDPPSWVVRAAPELDKLVELCVSPRTDPSLENNQLNPLKNIDSRTTDEDVSAEWPGDESRAAFIFDEVQLRGVRSRRDAATLLQKVLELLITMANSKQSFESHVDL